MGGCLGCCIGGTCRPALMINILTTGCHSSSKDAAWLCTLSNSMPSQCPLFLVARVRVVFVGPCCSFSGIIALVQISLLAMCSCPGIVDWAIVVWTQTGLVLQYHCLVSCKRRRVFFCWCDWQFPIRYGCEGIS